MIFSAIERTVLVVAALTAFALGLWGYGQYFADNLVITSLSDRLYFTLGLFLVEFAFDSGTPIPLALDIARWLAPASLSYAAIKTLVAVMHSRIQLWRIHRLSQHAVVCGVSEESLLTVESLCNTGIATVVLGPVGTARGRLEACGAYMLEGEVADQQLLTQTNVRRAAYLLAASGSDKDNMEIAFRVFDMRESSAESSLINCAVCIENPEVASALYAQSVFCRDYANFSGRIVHYPKLAARQWLISHGPDSLLRDIFTTERAPRILCLGANALIEELILRFAALGFYGSDEPLQVRWLGPGAYARFASLLRQRPSLEQILNLDGADMEFGALNSVNRAQIAEFAPDIIYVCAASPEWTLAWAQALADLNMDVPIVVCELSSPFMLAALERELAGKKPFRFINPLQKSCSFSHIFAAEQDKLARAIHENYLQQELQKGADPSINSSLVAWRELPETLKDANRSQADHMWIKVRLLTGGYIADADTLAKALTPERVEKLARIEHSRWVAEKLLSGWRYAAGEKDSARRLSPVLIPWEQLSESEKQKDRDAVKNLPALLRLAGAAGLS